MDRLKNWIKLKTAPGLGMQGMSRLLQTLGDPSGWNPDLLKAAFQQQYIIRTAYDWLASKDDPPGWQDICRCMDNCGIAYTTVLDNDYPELLKSIFNPPLVLYCRGSLSSALQRWNLGVVGTRKPSGYGKAMTGEIVAPLAKAGITIVSGLAYGIDTCAHKAALKAGGKTVAVLAHGLEQVYPPQNRKLAEEILSGGALVSEYEPGSKLDRWNFSIRNRIISGLSQGVLVTEGPITSGALITAKYALDQNRDIYALPGQVNLPNAQGPNHLIKQGAKLVTQPEDILQDFGIELQPPQQLDLFPELSEAEQKVLDIFRKEQRDISFDELLLLTGFNIGQLSIALLNLELKGLLLKSGGNLFTLR